VRVVVGAGSPQTAGYIADQTDLGKDMIHGGEVFPEAAAFGRGGDTRLQRLMT
jgi:hypothetical protein